jgi:hypothetical protein
VHTQCAFEHGFVAALQDATDSVLVEVEQKKKSGLLNVKVVASITV